MSESAQPPAGIASPVIQPTSDVPTTNPVSVAPLDGPTAREGLTSLDHPETSVSVTAFESWFRERATGCQQPSDFTLDNTSHSARFRHAGWLPLRRRIWQSMVRTGQTRTRVQAFCRCGSEQWVQVANDDPSRLRIAGSNCGDRLCIPCANLRAMRVRDALIRQIAGKPTKFITLTLCGKNEPLNTLIDRLYKHFRALRQHPTWSETIAGGAAIIEVKWSDKAQRWHPHLHVICEGKFLPQTDLCAAWRSITKDSYIVDIRAVKNQDVASSYVCKYASKPLNTSFSNTPKLLDEAMLALKGRRLVMCFGTWYGTPLSLAEDEELADDLIDAGGYTNLMRLDDLFENAAHGDTDAVAIIERMGLTERFRRAMTAADPP